MSGWQFYAIGSPAPQGSKSFKGMAGGHAILVESSKFVKPWRESIVSAAYGAGPMLEGPVAVKMVFTLPRPKSARKVDLIPCKKPDLEKLARAVCDAVTTAGLWRDDARVAEYARLSKVWSGFDRDALPVPGVIVAAVEMTCDWQTTLADLFVAGLLAAHTTHGRGTA